MSEPTPQLAVPRPVLLVALVTVLVAGCGDGGGQPAAPGASPGA